MNLLNLTIFACTCGADQPNSTAVPQGQVIKLVRGTKDRRIYDLAFSPRRASIVCAFSLEQSVQVWDVSNKPQMITTLTPPQPANASRVYQYDDAHPIAFSSDGARLATGYHGGMQIWDVDQWRSLNVVRFLWRREVAQFCEGDGSLLVGCSWRGGMSALGELPSMLDLVPVESRKRPPGIDANEFGVYEHGMRIGIAQSRLVETRDVYCVAVSQDGKRVYSGGDPVFVQIDPSFAPGSSVTVWDLTTGRRIFAVGHKKHRIVRFCLSPDGRVLYTCGDNVLGWDALRSAAPVQIFNVDGRRMISIAASADGTMLAAGSADGTVVAWSSASATRLATLTHGKGPVYRVAFSPASTKLVAAGEQGVATVWDIPLAPKKQN